MTSNGNNTLREEWQLIHIEKAKLVKKETRQRLKEQRKFMKCVKIRKCHLKLLPEMSGLMNVIRYPT